MKKLIFLACTTLIAVMLTPMKAEGQNIQLHYDLGRKGITSTVEMFKPDKGGSTFFFVDLDYTPKVSGAYFVGKGFYAMPTIAAKWTF